MTLPSKAWRMILSYIVIASLWILFSDGLLNALGLSGQQLEQLQLFKGLSFILITALLLLVLVRNYQRVNRRATEALLRSEKRLRNALEAAEDGMWDWHLLTQTLYCSRGYAALLGMSQAPAQAEAEYWLQRVHPDDREGLERALNACIAQRNTAPFQRSFRQLHTDGQYRLIQFRGRLLLDKKQRPERLLGTASDITQKRIDEESMRMSAVVFDTTQEGVLVTGVDKRIVHCNPAFNRITGYSMEEILGQSPSMLKSGRHDKSFYQAIWSSVAATGTWSGEIWNRRKSGEIYPQWQCIRGIYGENGEITHYVAVFSDISLLKRSQRELDYLAHYDPLSNLPNRLLFTERLEHALKRATIEQKSGAVLLIDLDHFKHVNESLGHDIGDLLIKDVAERIGQQLSERMTLARLGGDEFGLLYEDCSNAEHAAVIAEHLLSALAQPYQVAGRELFVTASIGISLYPDDVYDASQILRNADSALFKAKSNGRENYAFYTQELTENARQHVELASALRYALDNQQLRVHYQPLLCLSRKQVIGVEALVRWQHPTRGMVPPGDFIPIAEATGLIAAIDGWVLEQACRQMVQWRAQNSSLLFVAVNLSSRLFGRGELDQRVAQILSETGLDPAFLELEITESAVMSNPEAAQALLERLRALGLRLAIDDFGTGYSSLARLKRLPVHKLKLDQSFVRGLPHDQDDVAITRSIIALGHSMGLTVLAEGVEKPEQAELLKKLGCDLAQGYFYGRPVPPEQLQLPCAENLVVSHP